ncbi:MAG: SDR family oxidoreductase [Clostridia bacterium]|nr:SDR family oxidoreductase [Clostridia bacterium]
MDLGLKGRVAVVTAASQGLGRAVATAFAAEGARLAISSRSEAAVGEVARELEREYGAEVLAMACDLREAAAVERFFRAAGERYGRIDALFTNAGGPRPGGFDELTDADWQAAFELNLLSVVRSLRAARPWLEKSDAPAVVNDVSTSVKQPIEGLTLSNVLRAGVVTLTKSLSLEWAPKIRVNAIAPGRIATERVAELDRDRAARQGSTPEAVAAAYVRNIPLGRYGQPEELARVAVFLASPAASYVNGQFVFVDGGLVHAL